MSIKINEKLKEFFQSYKYLEKGCRLFVFREDGLMQYQSESVDGKAGSSCGALMGGTWQAAMTLMSFTSQETKDHRDFRLSFDSTTEGVHILSAGNFEGYQLYLGAIFVGQKNPAQLKNQLKNLNFKLRDCVEELSAHRSETKSNDDYLFSNITDSEIDAMFSVMES